MPNLNRVLLIGNLTRDPELRHTPRGTPVCDIAIAINRKISGENPVEETTYIDITTWGRTAELSHKYLKKGSSVCVEGRLSTDSWTDKTTGEARSKLKVVGEHIQFLSPKKD